MPSRSDSVPGGTTRSVRSIQAATATDPTSRRALPSGEVSATQMTERPSTLVGQIRTSPCPHGRNTPSTSRSRANVQYTGASEPMWKVMCTAYGSWVRYVSRAGTGMLRSGDRTSLSSSSRSTTVCMRRPFETCEPVPRPAFTGRERPPLHPLRDFGEKRLA